MCGAGGQIKFLYELCVRGAVEQTSLTLLFWLLVQRRHVQKLVDVTHAALPGKRTYSSHLSLNKHRAGWRPRPID
jgi:hypothetical protein